MEAFLSTLPPYVHTFLDKHPATDVFNLLKELICFAVLYSEDRERIKAATDDFLVKREKEAKNEENEDKEEREESEEEIIVEEPKDWVDALVPEIPVGNPRMPNTFPKWWGHQEFKPEKLQKEARVPSIWEVQEVQHERSQPEARMPSLWECPEPIKKKVETTKSPSLWVSFDQDVEKPVKRLSSQVVIPNLRDYAENTSPKSQPKASHKEEKPKDHAKTMNKEDGLKNQLKKDEGSPKPQRSPSVMKMPKQNAAVRARAEHAKQLQQEMLKKKVVSESSPTSQRLKQRASSGIDWDTIKRERRKTAIPEQQK